MKRDILKQLTIFLILVFTSTNILFAQQLLEGENYNIVVPDISPGGDFLVDENERYEIFATLGQPFWDPRMYSDSYMLRPEGQSFEPNVPEVACFETTTDRGQLPVDEGLVLHLDASAIEGLEDEDPVAQWDDLSGENNHATQATPANQPVYKTDIANGLPILRFSSDFLTISEKLIPTNSDFTIITVYSVSSSSSNGDDRVVIGTGPSGSDRNYWYSTTTFGSASDEGRVWYGGSEIVVGNDVRDNNFRTHALIRAENDWFLYEDKNLIDDATSSTSLNNYSTLEIGGGSPDSRYHLGDIAEILIYDTALSNEEREEVEQYLGEKWLGWESITPKCSTGPSYLNEYGMVRACGPQGCYNRARFEIDPQGNPEDTLYGVQISTDGFNEDIRYIDGNTFIPKENDERDITDYKTKEDWETPTFNLLNLESKTEYQLRITALYGDLTESVPSPIAQATTALSEISFRLGLGYEDGENINYNPPYEIRFDESFRIQRGANVVPSDRLIWSLINTNAISGISLVQKGEHGGLHNDEGEGYTITSLSEDLDTVSEGVGLKNYQTSQLYDDGITGSLASIVSEPAYDEAQENMVGIIDTIFKKTYGSDGPIHTGQTSLRIKTKASLSTPEGNYSEDVTFVLIANY